MCHPWASSQACPLGLSGGVAALLGQGPPLSAAPGYFLRAASPGFPRPVRASGRPADPDSLARARPRLPRAGCRGSGRGHRGAAFAAVGPVPVPSRCRGCSLPGPGEAAGAARSRPGVPQSRRSPVSAFPLAPSRRIRLSLPARSAAPCCCEVCTPSDQVSPSDGGGSRGAQVFWGPGRCEGGGAGRRHPASGRDSKLL